MRRTVRVAAVTAAFLAGASLIACAQSGATAGAAGSTAAAAPNGTNAEPVGGTAAGKAPSNTGAQGPDGSTAGSGSLPPCSSSPPYTLVPCR
jgi:hypothetical protein